MVNAMEVGRSMKNSIRTIGAVESMVFLESLISILLLGCSASATLKCPLILQSGCIEERFRTVGLLFEEGGVEDVLEIGCYLHNVHGPYNCDALAEVFRS